MNFEETLEGKKLLQQYFLCKREYYHSQNEELLHQSKLLLSQATKILIGAANHGDVEAKRLLLELEQKNHIRLKSHHKPWYYYVLWFLLFMYLLLFFFFLGQRAIANMTLSATPYFSIDNPLYDESISPSTAVINLAKDSDYSVHEPLLIIRNALYQYVIEHGSFPIHLSELTQNYPNNYLSSIPLNPLTGSNESYSILNEAGGWFYSPYIDSSLTLEELVVKSVQPNVPNHHSNYFSLLTLKLDLNEKVLYLVDENYIYYQFPIGVGSNQTTPLGQYTITTKLISPRSDLLLEDNPYGTRLMELSNPDYAIHGTNNPSSIGTNTTNGCIRLLNEEMELLFAMIPSNTPVRIAKDSQTLWENNQTKPELFYTNDAFDTSALHAYFMSQDDSIDTPAALYYETLKAIYQPDDAAKPSDFPDTHPSNTKDWRG